MKCSICGIQIDSVDEAVEQGWTPYFYDGKTEHEVACPACTHALLQEGVDGEMDWKMNPESSISTCYHRHILSNQFPYVICHPSFGDRHVIVNVESLPPEMDLQAFLILVSRRSTLSPMAGMANVPLLNYTRKKVTLREVLGWLASNSSL